MWTRERVSRLVGATYNQLFYWERLGLLHAMPHQHGIRGGRAGLLYEYKPLEVFKALVIAKVRQQGISLQRIRKGLQYLQDSLDLERPLTNAILVAGGKDLFALCYSSDDVEAKLLDIAQKQGQFAIALVKFGPGVDKLRQGMREEIDERAEVQAARHEWLAVHERILV